MMHICLPDTREVQPPHGSAFLLYNVHIDGLYHCSLRFKQLLHLHQILSKKFTYPYHQLPPFPPKKLLPLSAAQVEERRALLEKYMQTISQDKTISNSSVFNSFLLEAQRESTRIRENQVHLDIELVNGQKIRIQILTTDSVDAVLTAVCRALGLKDRYHAYFCLCLCGYDVVRDKLIIKRRLSFFESPYVTLQMAIQQQEQLQSILPTNYSTCCCQSCTATQNQASANNNSCDPTTTIVPLNGSSDNSAYYVQRTHHHHHHDNRSQQQQQQQHVNGNHHHQSCYKSDNHQLVPSSCSLDSSSSTSYSSSSFVTHRILLRKSYWDPIYDTYLLNDQQALNLLFIQTVYDIKHSLVFVNRETYQQLESLLVSDSKMEYILLARTLKYYNYVHFEPCLSDYPRPRTKVMISIGSKELNMRVLKSLKYLSALPQSSSTTTSPATSSNTTNTTPQQSVTTYLGQQTANQSSSTLSTTSQHEQILYCTSSLVPTGYRHLLTRDDLVEEEYNFKVLLIRSWRLSSLETLNSNAPALSPAQATGAGRRLRGLSLFNRKVSNAGDADREPSRTIIDSGTDGNSLLAALAGHRVNGTTKRSAQSNYHSSTAHQCHCENRDLINKPHFSQYELSFEYLVAKDTLRWITISSDQAIFISISLQNVVDELVSKRDGRSSLCPDTAIPAPLTNRAVSASSNVDSNNSDKHDQQVFAYMNMDGCLRPMNPSNQQLIDKFGQAPGYSPTGPYSTMALVRQRQKVRESRLSTRANQQPESSNGRRCSSFEISSFKKAPSPIINDAFDGETNYDDLYQSYQYVL